MHVILRNAELFKACRLAMKSVKATTENASRAAQLARPKLMTTFGAFGIFLIGRQTSQVPKSTVMHFVRSQPLIALSALPLSHLPFFSIQHFLADLVVKLMNKLILALRANSVPVCPGQTEKFCQTGKHAYSLG